MNRSISDNKAILDSAQTFVSNFFETNGAHLVYHNLHHTMKVVDAAEKIACSCKISSDDRTNLLVAAWFHDTGYVNGMDSHEEESVKIMRQAMSAINMDDSRIKKIEEIILSTRLPHNPSNLLCRIICDADMVHLSEINEYSEISENLRKELNHMCQRKINQSQWLEMNIEFLSSHCYFTEYGKKFLRPKKNAILRKIRRKFQSLAGI